MTDLLGPASAPNAVTIRPAETRSFTSADTFFKPCSSASANDGTAIQASWLNQVAAALRGLARAAGKRLDAVTPVITEDNANDTILADAVKQLIQRGQATYVTDTGSANAVTFAANPTPPEFVNGMVFVVIKGAAANTGAVTVNGAPLTWSDGTALIAGEWPASTFAQIARTAAGWVLFSVMGPSVLARASVGSNSVTLTGSGNWTAPRTGFYTFDGPGGGGGGGGAFNATCAASGGAAGGRFKGAIFLTVGTVVPYACGAAGTAGIAGGGNGGVGGTTTFGNSTIFPGGVPTATGGGGGYGSSSGVQTSAALAGSAVNGSISNDTGGGGAIGYAVASFYTGGVGSGPAPSYAYTTNSVNAAGTPGLIPGQGGQGASASAAGGVGKAGQITITW